MLAAAAPGFALEEPPDEMPALKACEKRLCTMILEKKPVGDDLECDVQKTWAKSSLEGGKSKGVSWGFGDARCTVDLKLERADIIAALTKPKHTVTIPAHQVNCILEREGEIKPLTAKLAPKLTFKNGKADKVWINLESIEGPDDVKSTIWTAAQLEDTIGIFHRPMIKSINKFMYNQCAKRYGPGAEAKAKKADAKKTKVAADKASNDAQEKASNDAQGKASNDAQGKASNDAQGKASNDAQERASNDAQERASDDAEVKASNSPADNAVAKDAPKPAAKDAAPASGTSDAKASAVGP